MKERFLIAGVLGLGAIIGGGAIVQHEQQQTNKIESLMQENQRLWGEIAILWANGCYVQAEADEAIQGQTDITPNRAGLEKCREYADKWNREIFSK